MNERSRPEAALKELAGSTYQGSGCPACRGVWLDDLLLGRVGLHDLPRPLFDAYVAGSREPHAQLEELRAEVARLNRECDRLWLWAFGDEARRDYLLGRLELAFAVADRPDVADLVSEAARVFLRGLDNMQGVAA